MPAQPLLVDSHCHLNMVQERGVPMEEAVNRAMEQGVGIMQTICTKMSEAEEVIAIAEKFDAVYASVGIHPHEAEHDRTTTEELIQYADHPKVISIGETGLDYYYEHSPRQVQQESFRIHIAAARETGCPLIVHTRDADEDTIAILQEESKQGAFPFLIHCFSTSLWLAEEAIKLGGYISIPGIVTFKKSTELQEHVKALPLEKMLVETDAPFLAPTPHRGKTNEPAFTRHTAEYIAELKGVSYEEVAQVTTENFLALFKKVEMPI